MPVAFQRKESPRTLSLAAIIARLGMQAEKIGSSTIEVLRDLMADAFTQEDRQHHRLSQYFLQLWKNQDHIITNTIPNFFSMNGSIERDLIDKAIAGLDDARAKINGYLMGLLMVALLNNPKVVDDNFVDHSKEFSYLIDRMVELKFGPALKERFRDFAEHCQGVYDTHRAAEKAKTLKSSPVISSSPTRPVAA